MCDTLLSPPPHTLGQAMLFAKNSDRQRNEAQTIECFLGAEYGPDAQLDCTYLTIAQARRIYTVVLCRPFWAWGAEMGANEHGVVIGNEAIHARSAASESRELPGMDLVRLGLERATTAAEALEIMTSLLERYGAGGNCGHLMSNFFNNGFVVADAKEAFVLETVDREWLVERIDRPRSLSNVYSIGREVERCSVGLVALLRKNGWTDDPKPNYAEAIANPNREHIGHARTRRARSTQLLESSPELSVAGMIAILRDHGAASSLQSDWHPDQDQPLTLCMHAGEQDRYGQTTGSMVSEIHPDHAAHWVTGSAAPCTSIFKPVLLDALLPVHGSLPKDRFDSRALWWRHERLHRAAIFGDLSEFLRNIAAERDAIECEFRVRVNEVVGGGNAVERSHVVAQCWQQADEAEERWMSRLNRTASLRETNFVKAWKEMNQLAGMNVETLR